MLDFFEVPNPHRFWRGESVRGYEVYFSTDRYRGYPRSANTFLAYLEDDNINWSIQSFSFQATPEGLLEALNECRRAKRGSGSYVQPLMGGTLTTQEMLVTFGIEERTSSQVRELIVHSFSRNHPIDSLQNFAAASVFLGKHRALGTIRSIVEQAGMTFLNGGANDRSSV